MIGMGNCKLSVQTSEDDNDKNHSQTRRLDKYSTTLDTQPVSKKSCQDREA